MPGSDLSTSGSSQGRPPEGLPVVEHSETAFQGRVVRLRVDHIRRADGSRSTREVVEHPDCVAVAAFLPDGRLVLVEQYRHPTRRVILEVPAGKIDPGEAPLEAMQRELREECGLASPTWKAGLTYYASPGYTTEQMHLFVAEACVPVGHSDTEADILAWRAYTREEVREAVQTGHIVCAKTLLALATVGWGESLAPL